VWGSALLLVGEMLMSVCRGGSRNRPAANGGVVAARDDNSRRMESQCHDWLGMAGESGEQSAGIDVEHCEAVVLAAGQDGGLVRAEDGGVDGSEVRVELEERLAGVQVPEADSAVEAAGETLGPCCEKATLRT